MSQPMTAPSVREALQICRDFIRGEMIEAAVVDVGTMQSLGDMIDAALNATPPAPTPSAARALDWLLGDEINGGLIRDICFTVWNKCHHPTHPDGNTDWGNDTLPVVQETVAEIRERLTALLPDAAATGAVRTLSIDYTNYRGETTTRNIIPRSVRFGSTEWHPEEQWLLLAWDNDKQADREFALKDFGPLAAAIRAAAFEEAAKIVEVQFQWDDRDEIASALREAGRRGS